MIRKLLLVCFCGLASVNAFTQERLVLNTPAFVSTGADFRLWSLNMRRTHPDRLAEALAVYAEVNGSAFIAGGRTLTCRYEGAAADALIVALNKTNLAVSSLENLVTRRCQMDGQIPAGTISGSPQ